MEGNGLALTVTVPFTTSAGAAGFAAGKGSDDSARAGGCVATGLAFGFSAAVVFALGCEDALEVAGGGVVFTAEFETVGAGAGRGCSTG